MILALHEGLRIVLEEGLERRFARHQWNAMALRVGLEALGLSLVVPEGNRLAQITPIWIPEGVDDDAVRNMLLRGHNIEIGKGIGEFAGKVWRVGLMGESSNPEYILDLLVALEDTLPKVGFEVAVGDAAAAARVANLGVHRRAAAAGRRQRRRRQRRWPRRRWRRQGRRPRRQQKPREWRSTKVARLARRPRTAN